MQWRRTRFQWRRTWPWVLNYGKLQWQDTDSNIYCNDGTYIDSLFHQRNLRRRSWLIPPAKRGQDEDTMVERRFNCGDHGSSWLRIKSVKNSQTRFQNLKWLSKSYYYTNTYICKSCSVCNKDLLYRLICNRLGLNHCTLCLYQLLLTDCPETLLTPRPQGSPRAHRVLFDFD